MPVPFTRFTPPHGHKDQVEYKVSPEVEAMAIEVRTRGYRFTIETLSTGHVSLCCEHIEDDDIGDIVCELVPRAVDEKELPLYIAKMIRKAYNATSART